MTLLDPDFLPACRFKIDGGGGTHEFLADHPHRQHVARMGGPFGGQVGLERLDVILGLTAGAVKG